MPIYHSEKNNYFKWGKNGYKYYYDPINKKDIFRAYRLAIKQGRAIKINKNS